MDDVGEARNSNKGRRKASLLKLERYVGIKKKKKRENKKGTKINYFGDHSTQAASSKGILRAYGICLRDCPCVSSLFREPVTDLCIFREWMARKRRFERGIN